MTLMILGLQLSATGLQAFHYGSDPVGNAKEEPRNEELEERSEIK